MDVQNSVLKYAVLTAEKICNSFCDHFLSFTQGLKRAPVKSGRLPEILENLIEILEQNN